MVVCREKIDLIILRFWDADLVAHAITMNEVRENNDTNSFESSSYSKYSIIC